MLIGGNILLGSEPVHRSPMFRRLWRITLLAGAGYGLPCKSAAQVPVSTAEEWLLGAHAHAELIYSSRCRVQIPLVSDTSECLSGWRNSYIPIRAQSLQSASQSMDKVDHAGKTVSFWTAFHQSVVLSGDLQIQFISNGGSKSGLAQIFYSPVSCRFVGEPEYT